MEEMTPQQAYEAGRHKERQRIDAEMSHLQTRVLQAEYRMQRAVQILSDIHALIDPPPVVVSGKTMVFQNPHAAEALRELSARIRAIPDRLLAEVGASGSSPSLPIELGDEIAWNLAHWVYCDRRPDAPPEPQILLTPSEIKQIMVAAIDMVSAGVIHKPTSGS